MYFMMAKVMINFEVEKADSIFGETGNDNLKGNNDNDALSCGDGIDIANDGRGTDATAADCETIKSVN